MDIEFSVNNFSYQWCLQLFTANNKYDNRNLTMEKTLEISVFLSRLEYCLLLKCPGSVSIVLHNILGLILQDYLTLTHYHTMPHSDTLKIYSCGKHCEKRRNCLKQAISPFLTMFSTLDGTCFPFSMHFKMLSAICFNLDQSKILSSGNGLKATSLLTG